MVFHCILGAHLAQKEKRLVSRRKTVMTALSATLSAAGLIVSGAGLAVPAMAVDPLPSTDAMYVLSCPNGVYDAGANTYFTFYNDLTTPLNSLQLFSVDPVTGEATPIGDGSGSNDQSSGVSYSSSCAAEPAWNPATQTAYFGGYIYDAVADDGGTYLMTINLETGESTPVAEFTGFDTAPDDCGSSYQGMAISDAGAAYVFDSNSCLYSLDLSTAAMTYIGGVDNANAGRYYAQAWSLNPVTSVWQVLENYDEFLSSVDVAVGNLSATGPAVVFEEDYDPQSLEFDSSGRGWAINQGGEGTTLLYALNPADGAVNIVGEPFTDADGPFASTSLLITRPAVELPNTGRNASAAWLWGTAGVSLLVAGIALGLIRRRMG